MPDRRYFKIAGITIQVESDLPISEHTFLPKINVFGTSNSEENMISIEHHFGLPDFANQDFGQKVFERKDLSVFRSPDEWTYLINGLDMESKPLKQISFANLSHTRIKVFNERDDLFKNGDQPFLSFYPTDQLFLTRALADLQGCMFHSSGISLDGKGMLFAGHSEAGKSTMVKMLDGRAEILCDDRIIVRKGVDKFYIHGTWFHGEVPLYSPHSAPLKAIFFLEKAGQNRLLPIHDKEQLINRLIAYTIKAVKPLNTAEWWRKTLLVLKNLVSEVPVYILEFDKTGKVVNILEEI